MRELDDFADLRAPPDFDLPADFFDADFLDEDFFDVDLPEDFPPDDFFAEDFLAEAFFDDDFPDADFFEEGFFAPPEPLRPLPDFLPPPDCLFTVAHARRSASLSETPRSS